jgi:serine/threonine protein kinase
VRDNDGRTTNPDMNKIGPYEIRGLLGEGGIGQVYAAFDTVLEREVAIKSLRPELLHDNSFVERFRAEATSLARLNHPNITTLYSLLPEAGNLYMVMERVRGDTLAISWPSAMPRSASPRAWPSSPRRQTGSIMRIRWE